MAVDISRVECNCLQDPSVESLNSTINSIIENRGSTEACVDVKVTANYHNTVMVMVMFEDAYS